MHGRAGGRWGGAPGDRAFPPALAVGVVILVGTAIRVGMAAALGLGIDESYMVASGRTFRLGYFDHPPVSWWLAAAAAHLAGSEAAWVVRLPFIALFAGSTWLMYRLTAAVASPSAGVWAALAFTLAPVFGVTTGGWVLPDGPLIFFLLVAARCLIRALQRDDYAGRAWWLGAGAAAGLALLSKYSAGLTLAGAFVYLLTQSGHRTWLTRPQPYVAALVAALLFAPVIVWNAAHGWASFAFQGGRAGATALHSFGPFVTLGGEALFLLPWIWLGLMIAGARAARAGPAAWRSWLLLCLSAGPILLFTVVSLWSRRVLYHWAAPGYLFLFPLLGADIARWGPRRPRPLGLAAGFTVGLLAMGLLAVAAEARWNWLGLIRPGLDPAFQALDWAPLRDGLATRGLLDRPNTVIAAPTWSDAGKIDHALGGAVPVVALNTDGRQYGINDPPRAHLGQDVLILAPRQTPERIAADFAPLFDALEPLPPVPMPLAGRPGTQMPAYLGRRLRVWPPPS